jgi:asparagine synthase (glutamine-hydrolysing)
MAIGTSDEVADIGADWVDQMDPVESMMVLDLIGYLPDDILTKVDRASMAVSLESRIPLLDHRLVELAWSLPFEFKIREHSTKWILRQVLDSYIPSELFVRPKMGFGLPIGDWMRGPLRGWAEDLLDERQMNDEGYFDAKKVRAYWMAHIDQKADHGHRLWDILMFQAWLRSARIPDN